VISLKFEGGADLAQRLARLPDAMSRAAKVEALKIAAEPMRQAAEDMAPYDFDASAPHLQDNIVIGVPSEASLERKGRDTEAVVEVGPRAGKGGDEFFYGRFQELEYGNVKHPAQPFLRPAFDRESRGALGILVDELWWMIRKGIDRF
jgi:HK97 gp10 family phage protein